MANSKAEMMSQARAISGKMKNQTPGGSNAYKSVMGKAAEMKAKAAEAGKAKEAQKSAMADKMKSAMATRQSADSKVQAMKAQADAARARQTVKAPAAKPAMPARPMGGGMGARPMARPTERIPRPAGTVSPNAAKMVGKTFGGMGMKKGGKARGR